MFCSLELREWRQFGRVQICFHERLTILTGANGSGKTTILRLLAGQAGWKFEFIGRENDEQRSVKKDLRKAFEGEVSSRQSRRVRPSEDVVGAIVYDDCSESVLIASASGNGTSVSANPPKKVNGLFVPSHRPLPTALPVKDIPVKLEAEEQLFERYVTAYKQQFSVQVAVKTTPMHRMKSSLISLATFGYGNPAMQPDERAKGIFEGFQHSLGKVLPPSLGFEKLELNSSDVFLRTATGRFSIDAASGGISAIIDLAWQLTLCASIYDHFVVIIDEPENHLHPQMERTLFSSLLEAFPQAQFIAATHSPLIIGSSPQSNVYVLNYNNNLRVESEELDLINRAGTSNEILRNVLDVPVTVPVWAEKRLAEIIGRHSQSPLSEESLKALRGEMGELGIGELFPDAIGRVMEEIRDSNK